MTFWLFQNDSLNVTWIDTQYSVAYYWWKVKYYIIILSMTEFFSEIYASRGAIFISTFLRE